MQTTPERLWALVLAGGDGTRLQPLTRLIAGRPIRIFGTRSLLETTLARIAPVAGRERTLVIVNEGHLPLARPQLRTVPAANVLVQPRNLDTGPGLLVSLLALVRRDREATVAVFPSDHDVRSEAAFRRHVTTMTELVRARPDRVALLGAPPERAETGYGYIAPGPRLDVPGTAFRVLAFHEKPAHGLAARIIRRGGLWNSFVIVARVDRLLALVATVRPDDVRALASVPADPDALAVVYDRLVPWNFSRDFLARIPGQLVVVRADDLGWSDVGTPEAIERRFAMSGLVPPWRMPERATA